MNELRMYVEHLFEGRVLTKESIELKEEIYGNLVARYEDYIAGGMSEAEALEKTKASFTSIEDVFRESGEAEGSNAEEGAAAAGASEGGAARWNAGATHAAPGAAQAPGADSMGSTAETAQMPRPEGAPVLPDGVGGGAGASQTATGAGSAAKKPRKVWPFVLGCGRCGRAVLNRADHHAGQFVDDRFEPRRRERSRRRQRGRRRDPRL